MTDKTGGAPSVDAQTFAATMGQAAWLMTLSKSHRDLPMSTLETLVSPAILLRQFKLYSKGKQPVAFLVWASVSDAVKARLESGDKTLALADWRSGPNIVIVECISPFNPPETFEQKFLAAAQAAQNNSNAKD